MKWAALVGGYGSNLEAMLEYGNAVHLVISHKANVRALEVAEKYHVPQVVLLPKAYESRQAFDAALLAVLQKENIEALALAGYLRWLGPEVIAHYRGRAVNLHPALLPSFPGLNAIEQAFAHGVFWTGVTVHFVDDGHDTGPIIAQAAVPRYREDTLDDLRERIQHHEHRLYPRIVEAVDKGIVHLEGEHVIWEESKSWINGHY
ncbi:MAG: phosphoribosylglycinamide formyltransferase [Sulfobacillus thermosulfidooxidans]|uniref:Phosphoribosylglycinamide formyltransferase n=1 Tax=Sulfobacillus thermotolerans TaxID=338644 RepID=A0ABM6RRT2_9FIRM|nr:phosphoribosylglycinamide formyltransferase [Sulfobacillus sp. hq2]AUW94018.1 phosphoribosylglycinamide formyltransferase [Sulfobacillus thermotolerans]MCY0909154.1 phosphoribosylglycinamide formyltransferase [Sulfobacillus thermotolerans]POB11879.1 phosphoribosylglycinamide formyltransferase [Sulfobacillus sp. hq2]PSR37521.1 MAG: phosphoribosylglycinamide formyltransferase [Sulfobacillus thermosulfidooxidans]